MDIHYTIGKKIQAPAGFIEYHKVRPAHTKTKYFEKRLRCTVDGIGWDEIGCKLMGSAKSHTIGLVSEGEAIR